MKKLISIFTIIVLLFIVSSFMIFIFNQKKEKKINEEYPNLCCENIYEEINAEGFLRRIETKDTFICLFGFPTCPWCQALVPVLNDVCKEEGLNTIYYIYLKEMRDNEASLQHKSYLKIYNILKEADATDEVNKRVNAPTIVVVKDGEVVASHLDTVSSHQIENGALPPLNDIQKKELINIIKELISYIK